MGYFIIKTGGKVIEGDMSLPTGELQPEQKAAAAFDQKNLRNVSVPFLVVFISYTRGLDTPYQLTHISPDYYARYDFDQTDFIRFVRDREEHRQNTYKLVYVREGELFQRVESKRHKYSSGSCFLLNRNVRHNEEYVSDFNTVCIFFSETFFRELVLEDERYFATRHLWDEQSELYHFFETELSGEYKEKKNYIDFIPKKRPGDEGDILRPLFDALTQCILSPSPGCSFLFKHFVCRIFTHLSNKQLYTTVPLELGSEAEGQLFSRISLFLEQHNGRVSREGLSLALNYSGSYLNRIVNKYTGMSITQYASTISMKRAAWMLLHSDASISDIIVELGYTNRTSFYRAFEEAYGETPRQYRVRNLGDRS